METEHPDRGRGTVELEPSDVGGNPRTAATTSASEAGLRTEAAPSGLFCARVVADEDGQPLAGVEVRVARGGGDSVLRMGSAPGAPEGEPLLRTPADGRFELSLDHYGLGRVDLWIAGRGRAFAMLEAGFDSPEVARTVRLRRNTTLVGHIEGLDTGSLWSVSATCAESELGARGPEASNLLGWSCRVASDGGFELQGLPAGARLEFTIRLGRTVVHTVEEEPPLLPGDRRVVDWTLPSGVEVSVLVLDEGRRPIPGIELAVVRAEGIVNGWISPGARDVRYVQADREGRAELGPMRPARWVVGLEGHGVRSYPLTRTSERTLPSELAAIAQQFVVPVSGECIELELVLNSGKRIFGVLLDPAGEPVTDAWVTIQRIDGELSVSEPTNSEGRFDFNRLPSGEYFLRAEPQSTVDPWWRPSERRVVAAGSTEQVVRLRAGARVSVVLVDGGTGAPSGGSVRSFEDGLVRRHAGRGPEFTLNCLPVGPVTILGAGSGYRRGKLEVEVAAGEEVGPLELRLWPAGRVGVRVRGEATTFRVEIEQEGELWCQDWCPSGDRVQLTAPLGLVFVRVTEAANSLDRFHPTPFSTDSGPEQRVEVVRDTIAELEFEFGSAGGQDAER